MSREIDFDKKLSDEDRAYLHERSQDELIAENDRKFAKEKSGDGEEDDGDDDEEGESEPYHHPYTVAPSFYEEGKEPVSRYVGQRPYVDRPISGPFAPGELEEDTVGGEKVEDADEVESETGPRTLDEAVASNQEKAAEQAEESEAEPAEEDDLDTWTVDELKEELRARGLSTSGVKSELVQRLREAD